MTQGSPKTTVQVLLLEGVSQEAVRIFEKAYGVENLEYISHALSEDELIKKLKEKKVNVLGIRSKTKVTKKVLDNAPDLITVGCFCIGTNQVDLNIAKEKGITVFNAPFSNTRSVAEFVVGATISLLRGLGEKNIKMHKGEWCKSSKNSYEVRGKNLGLVGYGNIGIQAGILASALGMNIYYFDPIDKLRIGNAISCKTLEELLSVSDVVSLHVPDIPQTKKLINKKTIAQMKDGAFLINYARGSIVDIDDLDEALISGKICGAALDVFPEEPASNTEKFVSKMIVHNNVLLTPHIGGSTTEAQTDIGISVAKKLVKMADIGTTDGSVNMPEITIPPKFENIRISHIHENVPGVMRKINKIFAEDDINITGQFLQTSDSIGYCILDVDLKGSDIALSQIIDKLECIEGTIKVREL